MTGKKLTGSKAKQSKAKEVLDESAGRSLYNHIRLAHDVEPKTKWKIKIRSKLMSIKIGKK